MTIVGAVVADHPDVRVALILFDVDGGNDVGDRLAVGRTLRIAHVVDASEVVEVEPSLRRLRHEHSGRREHENRQRERYAMFAHAG